MLAHFATLREGWMLVGLVHLCQPQDEVLNQLLLLCELPRTTDELLLLQTLLSGTLRQKSRLFVPREMACYLLSAASSCDLWCSH